MRTTSTIAAHRAFLPPIAQKLPLAIADALPGILYKLEIPSIAMTKGS
ncbi:hypothetical protein LBWT_X4700 (plasmid) [Leptolyngbya boryana IAM M-101]|nr:hypothetical protein LBWT_X4700 [Leptolyngbya boryana IAM M-101]BAS66746.1 hypothetical protein LBDG_X4700 [Leptolyngbya boryana dg5]